MACVAYFCDTALRLPNPYNAWHPEYSFVRIGLTAPLYSACIFLHNQNLSFVTSLNNRPKKTTIIDIIGYNRLFFLFFVFLTCLATLSRIYHNVTTLKKWENSARGSISCLFCVFVGVTDFKSAFSPYSARTWAVLWSLCGFGKTWRACAQRRAYTCLIRITLASYRLLDRQQRRG